jgi:SAM-dependent methyltransferase
MPLTDDFIEISNLNKIEYICDINIYQCDKCGIVQNPNDFNHEKYYQNYKYTASHSKFTQNFMMAFANELYLTFKNIHQKEPNSVIEIGSGDGCQLLYFKSLGVKFLKGIEPSEYLAKIANDKGVDTDISLFSTESISHLPSSIDICLSSYTFDHIRKPLDYLKAAYCLLSNQGILALEIHDFNKIITRTEYCLFEHEHTIYLTSEDVNNLLELSGFEVISINPLDLNITRGNSLIVIAKKIEKFRCNFNDLHKLRNKELDLLKNEIKSTIQRIDGWIRKLPESSMLVGFGAGGRGVMTIAALSEYKKITAILDSNFESDIILTPKTRIPIAGPTTWDLYKDAFCIIFSFGYYEEISDSLIKIGFKRENIISLLNFYPNHGDKK